LKEGWLAYNQKYDFMSIGLRLIESKLIMLKTDFIKRTFYQI